jgi:hypothetical protein
VVAPTDLKATASDGGVVLTWTASATEGVSAYRIYRGTSATELTQVAEVGAGVRSYHATGLTNGVEYFFALEAVTSGGATSPRSGVVKATPVAGTGGATGPSVTATSPADGATGVGRNANINVSFSKVMDRAATQAAFAVSPAVACDFTWNASSDRLTCAPRADLDADQLYSVTIGAGATDDAGNAITAPVTFAFTTGAVVVPACEFGVAQFGACVLGE